METTGIENRCGCKGNQCGMSVGMYELCTLNMPETCVFLLSDSQPCLIPEKLSWQSPPLQSSLEQLTLSFTTPTLTRLIPPSLMPPTHSPTPTTLPTSLILSTSSSPRKHGDGPRVCFSSLGSQAHHRLARLAEYSNGYSRQPSGSH